MDPWELVEEEIRSCRRCPLHAYRRNAVPGEGRRDAELVFIGEAPGRVEDETGRPFVGAAGKLLTSLIEGMGLRREDVYITNIVKCRPPNNRDPEPGEIEACIPYLKRQLNMIRPRVVVALGRHAARTLFEAAGLRWRSMARDHGRPVEAELWGVRVTLYPTYHPAAALYNPKLRESLEKDFEKLAKLLGSRRRTGTLLDYL